MTSNPASPDRADAPGTRSRFATDVGGYPAGPQDLAWHTLPDGQFDYVNGAWCALTGLNMAASRGDGWQRAVHPDDLPRWLAAWQVSSHAGRPWELAIRLYGTDGVYHRFHGNAEAILDAHGHSTGWLGTAVALDDNSRHALQAAWHPSTHVTAAVHDMKNQLSVIRGEAQLAERRLKDVTVPEPALLLHAMATIQHSTTALQHLVEELLDLMCLQSGERVQFNLQPTDLVTLARACVEAYAQSSGRNLTLSVMASDAHGTWDRARLERVIGNLLNNADKYSAPHTAIHVTVARSSDGEAAVLVVEDHGIGIPAADLPQLFTPFYRGSNVVRQTVGSGVGLFGARAMIEQQGGTLALESTEGLGTTVTIRLPLGAGS